MGFAGRDKIKQDQSFWGSVYSAPAEISDNYPLRLDYWEHYSLPEQPLRKTAELWISILLWISSLSPFEQTAYLP